MKVSFGYNIEEVSNHFRELEQEHESFILKTRSDIAEIMEKNKSLRSSIKEISVEIDRSNEERIRAMSMINEQLTQSEKHVERVQQEAENELRAAVNRLRVKRDELVKWHDQLKLAKEELIAISKKYRGSA